MNAIVNFRLCKLSDKELIEKVNKLTDEMYENQKVPTRHIPARPDADYDLLIGELLVRFWNKIFTAPVALQVERTDVKQKLFYVAEIRKLIEQYNDEEITFSRLVEILNEKATGLTPMEIANIKAMLYKFSAAPPSVDTHNTTQVWFNQLITAIQKLEDMNCWQEWKDNNPELVKRLLDFCNAK